MKYLGIRIDENLNWKQKISDIAINLNKANVILSKLRQLIDRKTLKSIYQTMLKPHLLYSLLVWAEKLNSIRRLSFAKDILTDYVFSKSSCSYISFFR